MAALGTGALVGFTLVALALVGFALVALALVGFALVALALAAFALAAFVTEAVAPDVTALGVLVSLALLETYTGVDPAAAVAGFASPATLTILAMYLLSETVQRVGLVDAFGVRTARWTRGDERRTHLATTLGIAVWSGT